MAEVTLRGKRPTLTVIIGDEHIEVPLTFNRADLLMIGESEDNVEAVNRFFAKYIGKAYDELGEDDLSALVAAWSSARSELGMPDMGESSASPSS